MKFIVGIDEVGKGPLAGPVTVCAVCIRLENKKSDISPALKRFFKGTRDSKKLSAKKREEIFKKIKQAQKSNILRYIVRYESAKVIDKKGISFAIKSCIQKCFKELKVRPKETQVFLDGGLKAPKEFVFQKTIIRGDDKKMIISLASIAAKVSRDALMRRLAKKFPKYGFDVHKGYGTAKHCLAIQKYGLIKLHRATFCRNTKY